MNNNQSHSCKEKELPDFLNGKTAHTISLFWYFVEAYKKIGKVTIHPTKSMIAFAAKTRIAYVTRLGKDFIDIVFPFQEQHADNLCFHKIAQVPGTRQFNHHFRMQKKEDINEEIISYMKLAYKQGQ
ncbi:MAG: hypothetical protein JST09_16980 [Bacteroidetes bacterium]|nr:hypothetical protein [Bacteroidota bacterium]MBS1609098.1 hypothetical protein [Bacteroidota bacterium]